jgi:hypothetical protein
MRRSGLTGSQPSQAGLISRPRDRQFFKLRVDLAGFDDIANFESPLPEIRSLCWYYRVFDAFVEYEKSPNILKGKLGCTTIGMFTGTCPQRRANPHPPAKPAPAGLPRLGKRLLRQSPAWQRAQRSGSESASLEAPSPQIGVGSGPPIGGPSDRSRCKFAC